MKYLALIAALVTAATSASALDDGKGFEWIVEQGLRPSDEPGFTKLVATIRGMPVRDREDLLTAVVADALDFAGREEVSRDDTSLCVYLLEELGSDKQKLEAFRNPEDYGTLVNSVARALASSADPESVAILSRMADNHLEKVGPSPSGEVSPVGEEGVSSSRIFFAALVALNESISPAAPEVANRLRRQLIERHGHLADDQAIAAMDRGLEKARKVRTKRLRDAQAETRDEKPSTGHNGPPGQPQPATTADARAGGTSGSPKWLWPGIVGGILVLITGWLTLKRR